MSNYKQLTYEQRCQIEVLKKSGMTQQEMAEAVGTSQSTISRELKRNTGHRGYRHKQAQRQTDERRQNAAKAVKMRASMIKLVEQKLVEKWSPEQISGWLREACGEQLSHERIYQHIWEDKHAGGELYIHLRRHGKRYQKRSNGKQSRGQIRNRVGIEERPAVVDNKSRIGDWEIDTVIGKGHSGAMVTIVERVTQFALVASVPHKSAEAVTEATIKLLKSYRGALHTITADNGKEFAYHERLTKELEAEVYFARPYHSWERGLNENTNGLLRQYWPKSMDLKKVTNEEVRAVVTQLNRRPRKTLGFKTPEELMQNHMAALAA
jgi:transposase, IS30 family